MGSQLSRMVQTYRGHQFAEAGERAQVEVEDPFGLVGNHQRPLAAGSWVATPTGQRPLYR